MNPPDIYNMKLHESGMVEDALIIRVAGGWLYHLLGYETCTFVPFNNEFMVHTNTNVPVTIPQTSEYVYKS